VFHYDDKAIDRLLDRDQEVKEEDETEESMLANEYLASFKVQTADTALQTIKNILFLLIYLFLI
jgi:hypothetical protein